MENHPSPPYWPDKFRYTPLPFSEELHPNILSNLLFTGNEEDLELIHPLIEAKSIHPHLTISKITDPSHILASSPTPQYGLFATQDIPPEMHLGTFAGKIRLFPKGWSTPERCDYALCMEIGPFQYHIDGKEYANEMVIMNDYRNIAPSPNVKAITIIHRGSFHPMFLTSKLIQKGQELLWDYGANYWRCNKQNY